MRPPFVKGEIFSRRFSSASVAWMEHSGIQDNKREGVIA
jgi:hypothetical protein